MSGVRDAAAVLVASGRTVFGAGFIAFLIVLALVVASFFLFRSMSRHLRNVPETFDRRPADEDTK